MHKDPELAYILSNLEIGQEIPPELYQAVAGLLVFVVFLEKKEKAGGGA